MKKGFKVNYPQCMIIEFRIDFSSNEKSHRLTFCDFISNDSSCNWIREIFVGVETL